MILNRTMTTAINNSMCIRPPNEWRARTPSDVPTVRTPTTHNITRNNTKHPSIVTLPLVKKSGKYPPTNADAEAKPKGEKHPL
jgi:hypothetical protein